MLVRAEKVCPFVHHQAAPRPRARCRRPSELLCEEGQELFFLARWKAFQGVFDFGQSAHGRKMTELGATGNR
jgi:hypothetical protein